MVEHDARADLSRRAGTAPIRRSCALRAAPKGSMLRSFVPSRLTALRPKYGVSCRVTEPSSVIRLALTA
jgi:hypothetical protein